VLDGGEIGRGDILRPDAEMLVAEVLEPGQEPVDLGLPEEGKPPVSAVCR
jgi:hypothetical protein